MKVSASVILGLATMLFVSFITVFCQISLPEDQIPGHIVYLIPIFVGMGVAFYGWCLLWLVDRG